MSIGKIRSLNTSNSGAELALIDNTKINSEYTETATKQGSYGGAYIHYAKLTEGTGLSIRWGAYYNVFAYSKPIDVTNYKTLIVAFGQTIDTSKSGIYSQIGISSSTQSIDFDASVKITTFGGQQNTYTVDISNITGNKVFKIVSKYPDQINGNITVSDIRFSRKAQS